MTEEKEGFDCRGWIYGEERFGRIKQQQQLTKYQIRVYRNALKTEKKNLAALDYGQPERKESTGCKYSSLKELKEAYDVHAVSSKEYSDQKYALWLTYSDRGHLGRIDWLEAEIEKCEDRLKIIENLLRKYGVAVGKIPEVEDRNRETARKRMRRYRRRLKAKQKEERYKRLRREFKERNKKDE